MLRTSLNKYAQVNEGSENVGNRSEVVSRQISRADIAAGCAKILSEWRYRLWGFEGKRDPSKGCSSAARGAARGWAAKLKFLRSSDDAATHKKFKRFTLWLVLLLLLESRLFFPNINSLFPLFACRLTTASFSIHPDTAQPRHPSPRCLRLATFTLRN